MLRITVLLIQNKKLDPSEYWHLVPVSIHSLWVKGEYIFAFLYFAPIVSLCSTWALFCLCCILVSCLLLAHLSFISLFVFPIYMYSPVFRTIFATSLLFRVLLHDFFQYSYKLMSHCSMVFFSKSDTYNVGAISTCESHSSSKLSSECAVSRRCFVFLSPNKSMLGSFLE